VNIGIELTASEGLDTTLIGGCMRWPGAFSLVGPTALESLNTVVMDRLFLGVTGIDARYGATVIESDEAAVFRAMSRRAKEVIVVADSSKVGMVSPAVVCPLASIDILITDDGIAEEAIDALRRSDVRVVIA
jgi:DeoR family transcriptional regulator of aga operon